MSTIPKWCQPLLLHEASPSAVGWCMFRDGKANGTPARTKRSLLSMYDLLPLIGLGRMERALKLRGIVARRMRVVVDTSSHIFSAAVAGRCDLDAAEYSVVCDWLTLKSNRVAASFQFLCGWLARHELAAGLNGTQMEACQYTYLILRDGPNRWLPVDKRSCRKADRMGAVAAEACLACGVSLVPVSFQPNRA